MTTRRATLALFAATLAAVTVPAPAQETPDGVVAALYAAHEARIEAMDPPLWTEPETLKPFVTEDLLSLFEATEARAEAAPDEVVGLDGDPFYDAQDWDISELQISSPGKTTDPSVAHVMVKFKNFGEDRLLDYTLKQTDAGWRIDDIAYDHGEDSYTLRGMLAPE